MKNDKIVQAYHAIAPDEAAQDRMFHLVQTRKERPMKKQVKWLVPAMAALMLITATAFGIPFMRSQIALPQSTGNVKARYINNPPQIHINSSLVELTEDEIFNKWAGVIFYGEVKEIRNIVFNFSGSKSYRAIADIEVSEVYRGDIAEGDVLSVLLPCPIISDVWVEDTGVISQLRVGMRGIFMPKQYSETDYWEENDAKLILRDVALYGMPDGERFAFLETPAGLVYAKWDAFPSLPNNATMDDVKILISKHSD